MGMIIGGVVLVVVVVVIVVLWQMGVFGGRGSSPSPAPAVMAPAPMQAPAPSPYTSGPNNVTAITQMISSVWGPSVSSACPSLIQQAATWSDSQGGMIVVPKGTSCPPSAPNVSTSTATQTACLPQGYQSLTLPANILTPIQACVSANWRSPSVVSSPTMGL
jgi:hypothetical protein